MEAIENARIVVTAVVAAFGGPLSFVWFMPTHQIVKRGLSNLQPEQSQEFVVECPSQTSWGQR